MPDIVGLAIEGRMLRAVEVDIGRSGQHVVKRTGELPIPDHTFENGRLRQSEVFVEHLRRLWDDAGFSSKRVRLVIDGRLAVVRRTELPSGDAARLRQAAGYDIAELLSYPIGDAVFDVDEIEQFERDGTTWARALVVAVEEAVLAELTSAITAAGLRLHDTDLAAEALARSSQPEADEGPVALVDCEDSTTNVVIRDASGLLFARTLNIGVGETTISVADELESALAQLSGGDGDLAGGPSDAAVGVSNVVEGIRRTLGYYTTELDQRPINRVVVVGRRGGASGLVASIENTLAMPCSPARSAASWPDEIDSAGFELPLGAAIGASPSRTRHLVLTSDRERTARDRRRRRLVGAAVMTPVIALLAMVSVGLWGDLVDARAEADDAERAADGLGLRVATMTEPGELMVAWATAADRIQTLEGQQLRMDTIVRELAESMPDDARLVDIVVSNDSVEDLPIGYDGPTPAGLVSISGVATDLDGVGRWLAQATATDTIDGLWLDQSTFGPVGAAGIDGAVFTVKGVITDSAQPAESLVAADRAIVDTEAPEGTDR